MKHCDFIRHLDFYLAIRGREQCWSWFPLDVDAYRERVSVKGRRVLVRRRIYDLVLRRGEVLGGPLKKGQPLICTCGTPDCLNPWHQVPATSAKAMIEKGEWNGLPPNDPRGAHNRAKTHCPLGHAFTGENTSFTKDGQRRCKACKRERAWLPLEGRKIFRPNDNITTCAAAAPEADDQDEILVDQMDAFGEWLEDYALGDLGKGVNANADCEISSGAPQLIAVGYPPRFLPGHTPEEHGYKGPVGPPLTEEEAAALDLVH